MLRWIGKALLWIGGGLVVLVAVIALGLTMVDWNWVRGPLASRASQAAHRQISVGALGVHWHRVTTVHLGQVHIDNATWDSAHPLAEIDGIDVSIDLLNLLRGRVVLPELAFDHPRLLLEKNQDGKANWDFSENPQGAVAGAAVPQNRHQVPVVEHLAVDGGVLTFRDPAKGVDVTSKVTTAVGGDPAHQQVTLSGQGTVQKLPFHLAVEAGSLLTLRETQSPYPLHLELSAGDTQAQIEGTVTDPLKLTGVDLKVVLSGADMAELFPLIGIPTPRTPAYHLEGRLHHQGEQWTMENFAGRVGASDLSGTLSVQSGGPRPLMQAELVSHRLDMADLSGFVGGQRSPEEAERRVLPDHPIELDRLRAMDMDLRFEGDHIEGDNMPLKRIDARLKLDDGRLLIDPLTFTLTQGDFAGRVELNGRRDIPQAKIDLALSKVDFGQFFKGTRFAPQMTGTLDGRVQLSGQGRSTAEVLGSGDGRLAVTMRQGSFSDLVQGLADLDIAKTLGIVLTKDQPVQVSCFVADLNLRHGVAQPTVLLLDTKDTTITGQGKVNLGDETLDLTVEGHPKHPSVFSANAPITADGPWKKPKVGVEAKKEAARGVAAVALGAVLTPLAAIIPFLSPGGQGDPPCAQLIEQTQQAAAPRR